MSMGAIFGGNADDIKREKISKLQNTVASIEGQIEQSDVTLADTNAALDVELQRWERQHMADMRRAFATFASVETAAYEKDEAMWTKLIDSIEAGGAAGGADDATGGADDAGAAE